jgi:hypothetical protein
MQSAAPDALRNELLTIFGTSYYLALKPARSMTRSSASRIGTGSLDFASAAMFSKSNRMSSNFFSQQSAAMLSTPRPRTSGTVSPRLNEPGQSRVHAVRHEFHMLLTRARRLASRDNGEVSPCRTGGGHDRDAVGAGRASSSVRSARPAPCTTALRPVASAPANALSNATLVISPAIPAACRRVVIAVGRLTRRATTTSL